jgi:hypothetical protein
MTDTPWLTPEQLRAWKKLVAVVEILPGVIDSQLQRDADLTHFEYFTLAMLSEAPERTLRMTSLASATNSTLPRLSHVVSRLEKRGFVERTPCMVDTAPGHVATVRENVIDPLDDQDVADLDRVMTNLLGTLDPLGRFRVTD